MYAHVIVDIANSQTDKVFDYSCPDTLACGCRVKVPFNGRVVEGFVTGVSEETSYPKDKIKPVASVYDELPALVPECFSLMEHISIRYRVPCALALRLFLPSEMRLGKVRSKFASFVSVGAALPEGKRGPKRREVMDFVGERGEVSYSEACDVAGGDVVRALIKAGNLIKTERKEGRKPMREGFGIAKTDVVLTPAQESALKSIDESDKRVILIHGVTGSGKTEIYLNVIAKAVAEGKSAIFLVPEISLTPQMLAQFRSRFGDMAAILHSGLSAGERFDEWWRLRSGEAVIAIGARSAIFAPLQNIGAIIIDEEHDASYISETAPRYSTVDIAKMRAEYNGCKLILGSATPSIESYIEADEGRYGLIKLTERINGRPMPDIITADMRREARKGNFTGFSSLLRDEIQDVLESGNQAILFLNRRGYSSSVICQECGYIARCEHCDVYLTYHKEEECLKCHYCGATYRMIYACPQCGGKHLKYGGTGTQKIVSELKSLFPEARVVRMDNDTVSGKDGHYNILKKFADREADILVGTQMIAKGHDFPAVTLVGVIDADMSLHFNDYRAGERTFQLITQVAGRSGRAGEKGKVIVQSCCPENYILRYVTSYDYDGFIANEKGVRKVAQYPPYALIVRMMVTGEDNAAALDVLKNVYFAIAALKDEHPEKFIFFNRMHSPVKMIKGKYRYQVLMRLTDDSLLEKFYDMACMYETPKTLVYVEENPTNLS
ncbi:MAG: primosomal protein N' [Clostridia bacterium]|nr:primosomal protein N' [Clostridia bacterium]